MAKIIVSDRGLYKKPKRKGVYAKTKQSNNKQSKNYVKKYKGQGR